VYKTLAAFVIATAFSLAIITPAAAQTKPVAKVLLDNASVTVVDSTYAPGAVSPMTKRPQVLVYVIAGPQKTKRVDANGHTTTISYPTGAAHFESAGSRSLTNVGTNTYHILAVFLKK
jgi:hypothetical protein